MNNYINDELVKADAMHGININDVIKGATEEIRSIYKTADEINRSSVDNSIDAGEGIELNNAADMIEKLFTGRKEYKRKFTKKNIVQGLVERKTISIFNPDKLHVGKPYLITFVEDISVDYDGDSFSFSANTSHTGIFLRGNADFISFVVIGPNDCPIIATLKTDICFYIQEYKLDEE